MDSQQLTVTDTTAMDTRLSTQKTISDGVGLVLALREGERALKEFFKDGVAPTHEIGYILQDHKLDGVKKSLDAVSTSLAALPHMPVQDFDIEPFRKWIQEHREKFDAFGAYCDELVRPESPLEEGEVHPDMERLSYALKTIEHRIDRLAPIVNPQAFEIARGPQAGFAAFFSLYGQVRFHRVERGGPAGGYQPTRSEGCPWNI
ncbi:hypothetical protein B0H11DRAFT_290051 [Mycena galericulata]|nr:hypothetical protein B0H11DRAFT_290051 [Mycena galericulata]